MTDDIYAITDVRIFDGYRFIEHHAVLIEKDLINGVVPVNAIPHGVKTINFNGDTLCAGFIDLQINGCGGVLFNDDISEQTIETMYKTNLRFGCTSFMPTLITTTDNEIRKAVNIAAIYYKKNPNAILGIHLEGPYINKSKRGAHEAAYIKPLSENMADFLCKMVCEIPIMLTLAPEENSIALIRRLALAGITVSIGHTNATYEEAMDGIANGVKTATHLFNAMSPFEGRKPGVVGAVLNSSLYSGIIIDGMHSTFDAIKLVKKIKGERIYIVTDAVTAMGTDIKEFMFAGQKVHVIDGKCVNEEGALAGSNIDMASSVRNAVKYAEISESEALRMATLYPAMAMGVDMHIGKIQTGMIGNLTAFDSDYNITHTTVCGKLRHR